MLLTPEIKNIVEQIIKKYDPADIYLFGSHAKGVIHRDSDVDLCLIIDVENKRDFLRKLHMEIDYNIDLDVVVYTPEQWSKHKDNPARFANIIHREGVSLIGRYH